LTDNTTAVPLSKFFYVTFFT